MDGTVWKGIAAGAATLLLMWVYIKWWGKRDSHTTRMLWIAAFIFMTAEVWCGSLIFYLLHIGNPRAGLFVYRWIGMPVGVVMWAFIVSGILMRFWDHSKRKRARSQNGSADDTSGSPPDGEGHK